MLDVMISTFKGRSAAIDPQEYKKKGAVYFVSFKPVPCFLKTSNCYRPSWEGNNVLTCMISLKYLVIFSISWQT